MAYGVIFVYFLGAFTFWPIIGLALWYYFPPATPAKNSAATKATLADTTGDPAKVVQKARQKSYAARLARDVARSAALADRNSDVEASAWVRLAPSPVSSVDIAEDVEAEAKSEKQSNSARSSLQKFINSFGSKKKDNASTWPANSDSDDSQTKSDFAQTDKYLSNATLRSHASLSTKDSRGKYDPITKLEFEDMKPRSLAKCPKFWAVARGGQLQLYEDPTERKLVYLVNLPLHIVTLWPQNLQEFELFYKRYPIVLAHRNSPDGLVSLDLYPGIPPRDALYLYLDNPVNKEDMYFALIKESSNTVNLTSEELNEFEQASLGPRDPLTMARPLRVRKAETQQLQSLIWTNDSPPETQWLNALGGRIFLALKDSKMADDYLRRKFTYKLKPISASSNLIGDIDVLNIQSGSAAPYISNIKLRELTPDGNMVVSAGIAYDGGFRVNLGTTVKLAAVTSLTTVQIPIELAATVRHLKGTLILRVKPAPSERIWYAFESMPTVDLAIEPVVYETHISLSVVTKFIRSRILDSLKETLVMPHMDDFAFHDTRGSFYRGGIWETPIPEKPGTARSRKGAKASGDVAHSATPVGQASKTRIHGAASGVASGTASNPASYTAYGAAPESVSALRGSHTLRNDPVKRGETSKRGDSAGRGEPTDGSDDVSTRDFRPGDFAKQGALEATARSRDTVSSNDDTSSSNYLRRDASAVRRKPVPVTPDDASDAASIRSSSSSSLGSKLGSWVSRRRGNSAVDAKKAAEFSQRLSSAVTEDFSGTAGGVNSARSSVGSLSSNGGSTIGTSAVGNTNGSASGVPPELPQRRRDVGDSDTSSHTTPGQALLPLSPSHRADLRDSDSVRSLSPRQQSSATTQVNTENVVIPDLQRNLSQQIRTPPGAFPARKPVPERPAATRSGSRMGTFVEMAQDLEHQVPSTEAGQSAQAESTQVPSSQAQSDQFSDEPIQAGHSEFEQSNTSMEANTTGDWEKHADSVAETSLIDLDGSQSDTHHDQYLPQYSMEASPRSRVDPSQVETTSAGHLDTGRVNSDRLGPRGVERRQSYVSRKPVGSSSAIPTALSSNRDTSGAQAGAGPLHHARHASASSANSYDPRDSGQSSEPERGSPARPQHLRQSSLSSDETQSISSGVSRRSSVRSKNAGPSLPPRRRTVLLKHVAPEEDSPL